MGRVNEVMGRINVVIVCLFLVTGCLFEVQCQTKVVIDEENKIYDVVDVAPEFPTGDAARIRYINRSLKYPKKAKDAEIKGTVIMRFVVEKDSTITNVEVERGRHKLLDEEATRLIEAMPKWSPGMINGVPVRTRVKMPIKFTF